MNGMKKISIVVPVCYNEFSLPFLFEALLPPEENLKEKGVEFENSDNSSVKFVFLRQQTPYGEKNQFLAFCSC
jgi:hypothetical protein